MHRCYLGAREARIEVYKSGLLIRITEEETIYGYRFLLELKIPFSTAKINLASLYIIEVLLILLI